mmetsp:Transcript_16543/g.37783  ORF Transcript_16543/g.37783 Transcript_16543/m.37783 type:complete len:85 (+) Transcript_16543:31-285(+)
MMRFSILSPIWAGTNQEYMMARPSEFAGFNSDITPQYDDGTAYYVVDIPHGSPKVAAQPGNTHALPYPATYGHKHQFEHQVGIY